MEAEEMSYINKQATIDAIAQKAKDELADVNHYFLEGVQLAVDVVEGMPDGLNRRKISEAIYMVYKNKSCHMSTEGVVATNYYLAEIWRELYGEEGPRWMR
jgi:hypothetical protein